MNLSKLINPIGWFSSNESLNLQIPHFNSPTLLPHFHNTPQQDNIHLTINQDLSHLIINIPDFINSAYSEGDEISDEENFV